MAPDSSPSPQGVLPTLRRIGSSRKGIAAVVVTITSTLYAVGVVVSYVQGKISNDACLDHLKGAGALASAAWCMYIGATGYEDGQEKAAKTDKSAE